MTVFMKLVEAYEAEGLQVAAGLNPTLASDFFAAPFAWIIRDNQKVTDGLGITPQEIYFLENLAQVRPVSRIFVIGNAFGWSTLALALANPSARVVAIDAGIDENTIEGLSVTKTVAKRLKLDVTTVKATSPQDIAAVVDATLGSIDLAFVDGFHSCEQILKDYQALAPFVTKDGIFVFHDVLFCSLESGFEKIIEESGWCGRILPATTTGMAILSAECTPALMPLVRTWGGYESAWSVVWEAANLNAHKTGREQLEEALEHIRKIENGFDNDEFR